MKTKQLLKRLYVLLPLVFLSAQILLAQNKKITGKVTDATTGAPIQGVSVQVKSTGIGVTTDASGTYSINFPANASVLVFSYIGFALQEITVGDKNVVDVKLAESVDKLSEVVVTGYGTQKKREVTSSITTVKAEQFNKGNISDVAQLLQGKVAGLSISRPGGDPNGGFSIRLRGLATLGANTQPLIVVDGQVGADINTVDPNDINSKEKIMVPILIGITKLQEQLFHIPIIFLFQVVIQVLLTMLLLITGRRRVLLSELDLNR